MKSILKTSILQEMSYIQKASMPHLRRFTSLAKWLTFEHKELPQIAPEETQFWHQGGQIHSFHWNYTFRFSSSVVVFPKHVLFTTLIGTTNTPLLSTVRDGIDLQTNPESSFCEPAWGQNSFPKILPDEQQQKAYWEHHGTSVYFENDEGLCPNLYEQCHSLLVESQPSKLNYYLSSS